MLADLGGDLLEDRGAHAPTRSAHVRRVDPDDAVGAHLADAALLVPLARADLDPVAAGTALLLGIPTLSQDMIRGLIFIIVVGISAKSLRSLGRDDS